MALENISSIKGFGSIDPTTQASQSLSSKKNFAVDGKNYPSFKDTLEGFLGDVNNLQQKADTSIQKMAAGEITDVHQVMTSVNEAGLAFNMMMEIRNKVMDAYTEVMRMRL